MSLHDFNLLITIITGCYALVAIFAPFKTNWVVIGLIGLNVLLGLIPL